MSKRAAETRLWEAHKARIVHLYYTEKKSLSEVSAEMASVGFVRTKAQYEGRFRSWSIKKNSKADVWKFVAERYHSRKLAGRQTLVELRGEIIPDCKVRKAIGLYGYQTTAERLAYRPRSQTPPEVRLFTPSSSPSPMQDPVDFQQNRSLIRIPVQRSWTDEDLFILAEATPWHQFIVSVRSLSAGSGNLLVLSPQHNADSVTIFPSGTDGIETTEVTSCSNFSKWFENMLYAMYTPDIQEACFHPACLVPAPFLPPSRDIDSKIDIKAVIDLSTRSTQLEFLKYAVNLISNNFSNSHISAAVVELLREKRNRALLQTLIDQNLIMATALLDNLWVPALLDVNLELLTMILNGGYDINRKTYIPHSFIFGAQSALQTAIEMNREELVGFLLGKGANANESDVVSYGIYGGSWRCKTLLELAAMWVRFGLVRKLTAPWPQHDKRAPEMTMNVLRQAISHGDMSSFHTFLGLASHLRTEILAKPWILLEAAAAQKNHQVFTAFLEYLNVQRIDPSAKGSILAAAYVSQDFDRVKMLHEMGANINSVAVGVKMQGPINRYEPYIAYYELNKIRGMSALHLAVDACDEKAVAFFIMNGADINQICRSLLPLQISVFRKSEEIIDLLLEAGANLSVTSDETGGVDQMPWDLIFAAGRPIIQIALESGHLPVFERLFGCGMKDMPYQTAISDSELMVWAIEGGNSELVERVINMTTKEIPSQILADCISKFGCDIGFDLISRVEGLDQTAIFSVEVLCAVVSNHDREYLQDFITNASKIRGALPEEELTVAMALTCHLGYFDMLGIFVGTVANPFLTPSIKVSRKSHQNQHHRLEPAITEALRFQETPLEVIDIFFMHFDIPEHDSAAESLWKDRFYFMCSQAILNQKDIKLLSRLLEQIGDVNWMPSGQPSYLQFAVRCERFDIAKYLLSLNADPNAPAISQSFMPTALQSSVQKSDPELFQLLLQKGAIPSAPPALYHGATATQYAAMYGSFAVLNTLLKLGMDINEPPGDHEGRTAIEGAAEHGRLDMVRYLLQAGADVKGRTSKTYRRTIYRAWSHGYRAIVKMVQDWKSQQYGRDDCESVDTIVETMTRDEMEWGCPSAKMRFTNWVSTLDKSDFEEWKKEDFYRERKFQISKQDLTSIRYNLHG